MYETPESPIHWCYTVYTVRLRYSEIQFNSICLSVVLLVTNFLPLCMSMEKEEAGRVATIV